MVNDALAEIAGLRGATVHNGGVNPKPKGDRYNNPQPWRQFKAMGSCNMPN